MKKIIAFLIIYSLFFFTAPAEEEKSRIVATGGLKLEMNFSNFNLSETSAIKSTFKVGGTFGGFVNIHFIKGFSLQPELLFHFKRSQLDHIDVPDLYQYWGCEIPIYAMSHFNLTNKQRIYVGLGPYSEFGFSATLTRDGEKLDLYKNNSATDFSYLQDFNAGFGIIVGYEFLFGLQINGSYKISISNVLDENHAIFSMAPQAISIGIAYRFRRLDTFFQNIKNSE